MNKLKSEIPIEYCTYCGRKLIEVAPMTADHFGGSIFFHPRPFDRDSGKLRLLRVVSCPKRNYFWQKFIGTDIFHDRHAIGDEYLEENI